MTVQTHSALETWPGGWAMRLEGTLHGHWKAYLSPIDAKREFHWTSSGGVSIPYAVMDDYGALVAVPGPNE